MATHRELILAYLSRKAEGEDDDTLAAKLGISPRQRVNQVCRQLAAEGLVRRRHDPVAGKILNQLPSKPLDAMPRQESASSIPIRDFSQTVKLRQLDGDADVQSFAYPGEMHLAEDLVKGAVGAALSSEGWSVRTAWGHAHGIDIEATRLTERLVVEAKGEGSLAPMRVNYFLGAIGELIQRMDSPDASYGLALPAHRQFVGLILRVPPWVRARLSLQFFLVRPLPGSGYEVGRTVPME